MLEKTQKEHADIKKEPVSYTHLIKEYGTLRAIGGERGQIYRLVSLQLLILCGAGIPIGLLLGILSAKGEMCIRDRLIGARS